MLAKIIRRMPPALARRPTEPAERPYPCRSEVPERSLCERYCAKAELRSSGEPELPDRVRVTVVLVLDLARTNRRGRSQQEP